MSTGKADYKEYIYQDIKNYVKQYEDTDACTPKILTESLLDTLADLSSDIAGNFHLSGEINEIANFRNELSSPLSMMIVGSFSVGKSSFINALLRKEVAVVNSTPTTAVVTKMVYGEVDKLVVHYKDGSCCECTPRKFAELTAESDVSQKELHSTIDYVVRTLPAEFLKKYTIIDTPGLNSIQNDHTEVTESVLDEADVVVWMYNASWALDNASFQNMKKLPRRIKPLVVINQMDTIDEDEDDEEEFLAEQRAKCGEHVLDVIGVSAKMALHGIKTGNSAFEQAGNISSFLAAIDKHVAPNIDCFKLEKISVPLALELKHLYDLKDNDDDELREDSSTIKKYADYVKSVSRSYALEKRLYREFFILYSGKSVLTQYEDVRASIEDGMRYADEHMAKLLQKFGHVLMAALLNQAVAMQQMGLNNAKENFYIAYYWYVELYKIGEKSVVSALCELCMAFGFVRTAVKWYEIAAKIRDKKAIVELALILHDGRGDQPADVQKAIPWLNKASQCSLKGSERARYCLVAWVFAGHIGEAKSLWGMENGESVVEKAWILLEEAIKIGYKPAILYKADCLYEGRYTVQDRLKAYLLYEQCNAIGKISVCYERDNFDLQMIIADNYLNGNNSFTQNIDQAIVWYKNAYNNGAIEGAYALGCLYASRFGGRSKYYKLAKQWLYKGVEKQHIDSAMTLAALEGKKGTASRRMGLLWIALRLSLKQLKPVTFAISACYLLLAMLPTFFITAGVSVAGWLIWLYCSVGK